MTTKIHGIMIEADPLQLRGTMDVLTRPRPEGSSSEVQIVIDGYPVAFGKLDAAEFVNGGLRLVFRKERTAEIAEQWRRANQNENVPASFYDAATRPTKTEK